MKLNVNVRQKFIGQTMQHLYLLNIKNETESTSLSKHTVVSGQCYDLENCTILSIENNYIRRLFSKMMYIKQNLYSINYDMVTTEIKINNNFALLV